MNNSNYLSFTLPIFQSSGKIFVHNEFRARFPPCGGAAHDDDDDTGKVRYGPALQLVCNSPFSRGLIFMCFCRLHVLLAAVMGILLAAVVAAAAATVENKEPSRRSQKREENPSGDRIAFCAF